MVRSFRNLICTIVAFAPLWSAAQVNSPAPLVASRGVAVVDTEEGKLQGFIHQGIFTYRGVPYAKAGRFMPPEKPAKWEGIRTALTYGYISPQVQAEKIDDVLEFIGPHRYWIPSDDCQNLNIWTPGISDGKRRPVMVWLHGGGFTNGSSIEQPAYDGENLSRKGDVVVVTVNHRLNAVGFLDLSTYGAKYKYSGNVGMMDLVAALEWIHANIANFGGDPSNVTIFGQSGGGGKVITLMATPAAKGLFQKAIVESGAAPGMGMTLMEPKVSKRIAELTLQNLHLNPAQVDQLQTIPYRELHDASDKALKAVGQESGAKGTFGLMWSPICDGDYIPAQPFSSSAPAQSKDIPLLIGTTLNEFPVAEFNPRTRGSNKWSRDEMNSYLRQKYGQKATAVADAYRKAYPQMKYTDWLYVDNMFRPGALVTAALKSDQQGAPVYTYLFTWQSPVMDGWARSVHCLEIPFVFDNISTELEEQTTGGGPAAYALADKVSQAWINFARTGDPNNANLPKWPTFTRENGATMILDNVSEVRYNHDKELMVLLNPDVNF